MGYRIKSGFPIYMQVGQRLNNLEIKKVFHSK